MTCYYKIGMLIAKVLKSCTGFNQALREKRKKKKTRNKRKEVLKINVLAKRLIHQGYVRTYASDVFHS